MKNRTIPPTACAWHLALWPSELVPLNGTTVDEALAALEDKTLSHGMCPGCSEAYRVQHGLSTRRAA